MKKLTKEEIQKIEDDGIDFKTVDYNEAMEIIKEYIGGKDHHSQDIYCSEITLTNKEFYNNMMTLGLFYHPDGSFRIELPIEDDKDYPNEKSYLRVIYNYKKGTITSGCLVSTN